MTHFTIKSFYIMKMLLKITSKKTNAKMLSFYFKIPNFNLILNLENNLLANLI